VVRDVTEREKRETELIRSRQELRHLASELSLTGLRERQRIAAELHDGICQMLSSSSIYLAALKEKGLPEETEKSIDKVSTIVEESLNQTRSLIFELSCPMLKELGLEAALEELCCCMTKEQAVHFEFKSNKQSPPLTAEQQTILYRSTRELLTNVAKHSKATSASLTVSGMKDKLRIFVEDDGIGFDAATAGMGFSPSGGFGLFNLSEYLQHAGGEISFDSTPGCGTRVTITLPRGDQYE
jgi:signal transduction histidine kinase